MTDAIPQASGTIPQTDGVAFLDSEGRRYTIYDTLADAEAGRDSPPTYCPSCLRSHPSTKPCSDFIPDQTFDTDVDPKRDLRIEALHAASRIVAGASFGSKITIDNGKEGTDAFTVDLARRFMPFLEDG